MEIIKPPAAYIQDTGTAKGRGVFAARNFSKDERVEVAPVIVMYRPYPTVPPVLKKVVFNWTALAGLNVSASAVVLGFGSMYNHANPANLRYRANPDDQTILFIAARDITEHEELTINYNANGGLEVSSVDDWFERNNITPI